MVARFLAESEEVRNKEGFIKIYRRYHPTGKKNRKDEGAKDEDPIPEAMAGEPGEEEHGKIPELAGRHRPQMRDRVIAQLVKKAGQPGKESDADRPGGHQPAPAPDRRTMPQL